MHHITCLGQWFPPWCIKAKYHGSKGGIWAWGIGFQKRISNGMKLRDYRWANWGSEMRSSWNKSKIGSRNPILLISGHRWERKNKFGLGRMELNEVMFGWYGKTVSWVGGKLWLAYIFLRPFFFFMKVIDMQCIKRENVKKVC